MKIEALDARLKAIMAEIGGEINRLDTRQEFQPEIGRQISRLSDIQVQIARARSLTQWDWEACAKQFNAEPLEAAAWRESEAMKKQQAEAK